MTKWKYILLPQENSKNRVQSIVLLYYYNYYILRLKALITWNIFNHNSYPPFLLKRVAINSTFLQTPGNPFMIRHSPVWVSFTTWCYFFTPRCLLSSFQVAQTPPFCQVGESIFFETCTATFSCGIMELWHMNYQFMFRSTHLIYYEWCGQLAGTQQWRVELGGLCAVPSRQLTWTASSLVHSLLWFWQTLLSSLAFSFNISVGLWASPLNVNEWSLVFHFDRCYKGKKYD